LNIYDISEKAGVSIATVSRVLNNNPHVAEATRRRVMRVITQSGYTPNAFARGLGLGSMKTIGLLCPDVSDPYHATALSYLESDFRENGYHCILSCTGRSAEERALAIEDMRRRHVDGMVLMGSGFGDLDAVGRKRLQETAAELPVFMLNGMIDCPGCYCVRCDDEQASHDATEYLITAGARRILYLYHSDNAAGRRKMNGVNAALTEHGMVIDPQLQHKPERDDFDSVRKLLLGLRDQGITWDAVICSEDQLAVATLKYAIRAGIKVPEEMQIVGYNDLSVCRLLEPELSTVDVHLPELCARIVSTMLTVFAGEEVPQHQLLSGTPVLRGSTRSAQ